MHETYPEFMQAYEAFGLAAKTSGPLSSREVSLVKLAISIGAGLEGAVHSHCRKALCSDCQPDDLRHVAMLSAPTIGFPTMMRARSWVNDVLDQAELSKTDVRESVCDIQSDQQPPSADRSVAKRP